MVKITVDFKCPAESRKIAQILNEIANYLEGTKTPPELIRPAHWEESKQLRFYAAILANLTPKACKMLKKLS